MRISDLSSDVCSSDLDKLFSLRATHQIKHIILSLVRLKFESVIDLHSGRDLALLHYTPIFRMRCRDLKVRRTWCHDLEPPCNLMLYVAAYHNLQHMWCIFAWFHEIGRAHV